MYMSLFTFLTGLSLRACDKGIECFTFIMRKFLFHSNGLIISNLNFGCG